MYLRDILQEGMILAKDFLLQSQNEGTFWTEVLSENRNRFCCRISERRCWLYAIYRPVGKDRSEYKMDALE